MEHEYEEVKIRPCSLTLAASNFASAYKTHLNVEIDTAIVPTDGLALPSYFPLQVRNLFLKMSAICCMEDVSSVMDSVAGITASLQAYVQILQDKSERQVTEMNTAKEARARVAETMVEVAYETLKDRSPESLEKFKRDTYKYYEDLSDNVSSFEVDTAAEHDHVRKQDVNSEIGDIDGIIGFMLDKAPFVMSHLRAFIVSLLSFYSKHMTEPMDIILEGSARALKVTACDKQRIAELFKQHKRSRKLCRTSGALLFVWKEYAVALSNVAETGEVCSLTREDLVEVPVSLWMPCL